MDTNLGIMTGTVVLSLCLGTLAIVLSDLARFPSILVSLLFGLAFGANGLSVIKPELLGEGLGVLVTVFVGLIIFEGAFSLKLKSVLKVRRSLFAHIAVSTVLVFAVAFACARALLGLSLESSLTVAALSVVTGPTVVKPILRHLPLRGDVKTFLLGEGIAIDLVGAVLAIVIVNFFVAGESLGSSFAGIGLTLAAGIASGTVFGFATHALYRKFSRALEKTRVYLFLLSFFAAFFASESIKAESGMIAVAALGFVFSRLDFDIKEEVLSFKEKMTRILISFLFILLSAKIDVGRIGDLLLPGLATIAALAVARFVAVLLSARRSGFSLGEKAFIAWVGPRGIIAVSVASIASLKLERAGIADAGSLEAFVFLLVIVTVAVASLTAGPLARALGVERRGSGNILILGVNELTLAIARAWKERSLGVLFIDSDRKKTAQLAREGFAFINANGVDPASLDSYDLDLFETAIAATSNYEINILFCQMIARRCDIGNAITFIKEENLDEFKYLLDDNDIRYNVLPMDEDPKSLLRAIKKIVFPAKVVPRTIDVDEEGLEAAKDDRRIVKLAVARGKELYVYAEGQEIRAGDKLLAVDR